MQWRRKRTGKGGGCWRKRTSGRAKRIFKVGLECGSDQVRFQLWYCCMGEREGSQEEASEATFVAGLALKGVTERRWQEKSRGRT